MAKKVASQGQNKVERLLTRNVEDVFVKEDLKKKLEAGKPLRVKLGFDPTGADIHIGRAVALWKLREFQELGHTVVFLVGDFTALIGDPSDKLAKRPMLTEADIQKNLQRYKEQVGKIVDLSKAEFVFNSTWLAKLSLKDLIALAESFSIQQMSARRNFKERFDRGDEVSLREFLYPLLQGYDSVALKADVEIGGFDQLFNLKAGRIVQKHFGQPEQNVLTTKMLLGTDGRKMSTSWGNVITLVDAPSVMFGKVMSLKDELINDYFELCTNLETTELAKIRTRLEGGENPKNLKLELAETIVTRYHGTEAAKKAHDDFSATFEKGGVPEDVLKVEVSKGALLSEVLLTHHIIASKSEWQRLVKENAVSFVGKEKITDPKAVIEHGGDLKVGKRRFINITIR
jgi:tyrosyl-tRNA synthetase